MDEKAIERLASEYDPNAKLNYDDLCELANTLYGTRQNSTGSYAEQVVAAFVNVADMVDSGEVDYTDDKRITKLFHSSINL